MKMNKGLQVMIKILAAALVLFYCVLQGYSGGDFKIYLGAAELLREGKSCYNVWIHLGGDNYCGYSYSPFFATILIPFSYLSHTLVQIMWLVVNLFILYRLFKIIEWYLPTNKLSTKQFIAWILLGSLLTVRFVLHNFEMVQMTIFILYCCLEATYQLNQKKVILSAFLVALGIIVKVIPIILIPYFLYRKQYKVVGVTLFFLLIFIFSPALLYGWDFNNMLLSDWMNTINPSNPEFVLEQNKNGEGVHSLSGFLAAYFTNFSDSNLTYNRTLANLDNDSLQLLLNAFRLFFIALTLYFLKFPPFSKVKSKSHEIWELSYLFCITPLIFPHQQKYAFFLMAPAVFVIIFHLVYTHKKEIYSKRRYRVLIYLIVLHFILATLTTDGIIGRNFYHIAQYYKTITFGNFLLIIALMICKPRIMEDTETKVQIER